MPSKNFGRQLWDDLVNVVAADDGLPVLKTKGMWTASKLFFVCQYLEQLTRGMKRSRSKWPAGLTYVDLFCGTGVSQVEVPGEMPRRFPGSPLIAASTPTPFDRLILIDREASHITAVQSRVQRTEFSGETIVLDRDTNTSAEEISDRIPSDSLNVTFIDPFSLDIEYDTVRLIASRKSMDLIILFSDRFDLGRNVHKYYYPEDQHTKLDRFLGIRDWRHRLESLPDQSGQNVRRLFADIYEDQLRKLGYPYHFRQQLDGPQGPVFTLLYASKHELGLKYCEIAARERFDGSRGLFG